VQRIGMMRVGGGDLPVQPFGRLQAARAVVFDGLLERFATRSVGHSIGSFRVS
jgi:hypothetical protein